MKWKRKVEEEEEEEEEMEMDAVGHSNSLIILE